MRLLIALILFVGMMMPVTLSAARFDWSLGQPVVVEDLDNATHGTRYDWVLGQPTIVREDGSAAPAEPENPEGNIESKGAIIKADGIINAR